MKQWKWRMITCLLVLAAGLFIFTGCGKSDQTASDNSGSQTTLTFRIWDIDQKAGMEKIAQAYMDKHPDIKIEVQVTGWSEYWTKLEAGATSDTLPDVFWMHTNEILDYADSGMLADCSEIVDTSHFSEQSLKNAEGSNGTLYGVPKDKDTVCLVYNTELFDEAGVSYPDDTWTWDNLNSASEQIYEKTGKYGYMAYADEQLGYWNFVYQAGGRIINDDGTVGYTSPATEMAMKYYIGLQQYDWCPDQNYFAETSPADTFFSGNGAMFLAGDWNLLSYCSNYPDMKGKWNVAVLPKCPNPVSGDGRATVTNGLCYATSASGAHHEQAMDFLEFLGSEEAQKIEGESGAAIPAYKGLEYTWADVFKKDGYDIDVQACIDMFDYGIPGPNDKSRPAWKIPVNAELLKIYAGYEDIDSGLQNMQNLVEQEMKGY